jgi:hypothetical protein
MYFVNFLVLFRFLSVCQETAGRGGAVAPAGKFQFFCTKSRPVTGDLARDQFGIMRVLNADFLSN